MYKITRSYSDICSMNDRGSIAEKALTRSGIPKGTVAERLNISRKTLYNRLSRPDLEYDFIIELYKILRIDVIQDFPELGKYVSQEKLENEVKAELEECRKEAEMWKNKYIQLMEKHLEEKDSQGKRAG